jgi:hypothetical protein
VFTVLTQQDEKWIDAHENDTEPTICKTRSRIQMASISVILGQLLEELHLISLNRLPEFKMIVGMREREREREGERETERERERERERSEFC